SASKEGAPDSQPMADIPVLAEAAVGVWHEEGVDNMSQRDAKKLTVPPEVHWAIEDEYAVQVRDGSLNKLVPQDGYCICRRVRPGPMDTAQIEVGSFVHIERTRRGGLKEISVRRVSNRDGAALRLSNYSNDRKYRSNDLSYPAQDGKDGVTIKGVL